jgi:hypothetical protein
LAADHPQAIDYINTIRFRLRCEATFNRLQMSAELQKCKKVVTTPGWQKEKPPHPVNMAEAAAIHWSILTRPLLFR